MRLVVVTGVSGAGKSTALRTLEDLGFYAVDNLPLPLVPKLIEVLASRADISGSSTVPSAMPSTPSGSWSMRSA